MYSKLTRVITHLCKGVRLIRAMVTEVGDRTRGKCKRIKATAEGSTVSETSSHVSEIV